MQKYDPNTNYKTHKSTHKNAHKSLDLNRQTSHLQ